MPGIAAIAMLDSPQDLCERLKRGAARLTRKPWHKTIFHESPPVPIAAAYREGALPGADLWVSEDKNLIVAIDGEIYGGEPANKPDGSGVRLAVPTSRCGSYIATLYREHGNEWVTKVRGAFAVVIINKSARKVMAFTDRFGLRPLSYAVIGKSLFVGSNMASIVSMLPEHTWKFDMDALADWFTFNHVLGELTFLEDIHLMPNAGRMVFELDTGQCKTDRYWTLDSVSALSKINFDEAAEEACRLFDNAVKEQAADGARIGVYLTGGLDSRSTAGFLTRNRLSFCSFTYGVTGCRDMVWGAELARKTGSRHLPFPMDDGSWVHRYAEDFVAITESFASCYHSHGIHTYERVRELIDAHLSGYGGGSFLGGDTTTVGALAVSTTKERAEALYRDYVLSLGNVFRSPIELRNLFCDSFWREIGGRAEESFSKEFSRYAHLRPEIIGDAFTLANRYKKMFAYLIAAERDYFEDRSPYMDYNLMDFIFSIPTGLRLSRQIQIAMLDRMAPELTRVPWQVTALPATRDIKKIRRYSRRIKIRKLADPILGETPAPFEPGRNYPKWLRESGLPWTTEILSDPKTARRGFDPDYLSILLKKAADSESIPYPEQRNLAFRIGAVISFELMCRMVLDGGQRGNY